MKKSIEWKTPKEYQRGWFREALSAPAKLARGYCKKLKGKHDYVYHSSWGPSLYLNKIWEDYRCSGCGKVKSKLVETEPMREILKKL